MQRMECQDITIRLWRDYQTTLGRAAAAIGKINRFQGRLRVPVWTVLHHSYLGYELASRQYEHSERRDFVNAVYLHFLLHDIPEALWGDVNGHVKTLRQRAGEGESMTMLLASLGIAKPGSKVAAKVHELDSRCMYAEAAAFGDRADAHVMSLVKKANPADIEMAQSVRQTYWRPEHSLMADGELVKDYLTHLGALLPIVQQGERAA